LEDSPARSRGIAVPGEAGDLGVAATAEALTADGGYARLVAKASKIVDACGGFAGLG